MGKLIKEAGVYTRQVKFENVKSLLMGNINVEVNLSVEHSKIIKLLFKHHKNILYV